MPRHVGVIGAALLLPELAQAEQTGDAQHGLDRQFVILIAQPNCAGTGEFFTAPVTEG